MRSAHIIAFFVRIGRVAVRFSSACDSVEKGEIMWKKKETHAAAIQCNTINYVRVCGAYTQMHDRSIKASGRIYAARAQQLCNYCYYVIIVPIVINTCMSSSN